MLTVDQKIQLAIVIILAVTLSLILLQLWTQFRLAKAQLLRDRFEMYIRTNEPVTDEHIKELKLYPADYMDVELYKLKYNNDQSLRKYIYMATLYEYLAYTQDMPYAKFLNSGFTEMWVNDLCQEDEFRDVHKYYEKYYPRFAEIVEKLLNENAKNLSHP